MHATFIQKHLLKPETYPDSTEQVEYRETHISRVYLTKTCAYKFKKPLDLNFLNFTSLERRRHFCLEEVRLNRRFCPRIYLGVVSLNRSGDRLSINGPGTILDYAVQMRRLPEERMLDKLLEQPEADLAGEVTRLAATLNELYPRLSVYRGKAPDRYLDMVRANWRENFSQTRPFIDRTLPAGLYEVAQNHVSNFIEKMTPLLLQREAAGFVRDCHGDLHSRNICMTDPVCIYDCIEFNRRFRLADILDDLSFLLMDFEFRQHRHLSRMLLKRIRPILGPADDVDQLLPFYKFYRAWVRGKVQSFQLDEEEIDKSKRAEIAASATRYFNLALGLLCPPGLLLTCGLMGSGKTTVARSLEASTGATLLRSDLIRKELASPQARLSGASDAYGKGLYTPQRNTQTYAALLERAEKALREERLVIVDASFGEAEQRKRFLEMAKRLRRPGLILHVVCDRELALQRLDSRQHWGGDASDGRRELYDLQAANFALPVREAPMLKVDSSQGLDYNVALIIEQYLRAAGLMQ